MLKDLLDKGKCALGYHLEAWQYADSGACRQVSRCTRCGVVSERMAHVWSGWQRLDEASCTATRTCLRCGQAETKDDHDWNAWVYDEPDVCRQRVRCSRCTAPGTATRLQHDRGDWQWSEFYETGVAVCRRCGEMVFATVDGEEEPVTFQQADAAIMHVVGSSSAEVRQRVSARQGVLFSPVAAHVFRYAADQRATDEDERKVFADLAGVVARCRDEGLESVFARPAAPPASSPPPRPASSPTGAPMGAPTAHTGGAGADPRLVGHWRHTEALSSGGFSLVTDTNLVLDASGRFGWWSHSVSAAMGTDTTEREEGTWDVTGRTLSLQFDDGATMTRRCDLDGNAMLWPEESRYRLWRRVG